MTRRGKDRSGIFERGDDRSPSDEEVRALRATLRGEQVNRSHNRVALAEIEAEAVGIVEAIYHRFGLPIGPDARQKLFVTSDRGLSWKPYADQTLGADDELRPWSALGYATHGRPSEAGFASAIAAKLDRLHVADPAAIGEAEHDDVWLSAFLGGFRLAAAVAKWRWEFENRSMVDVSAPEARSTGGRVRGAQSAGAAKERAAVWQAEAERVWSDNPSLTKSRTATAAKVRDRLRLEVSVSTIRQALKKPDR